jgi:hypothetical protein
MRALLFVIAVITFLHAAPIARFDTKSAPPPPPSSPGEWPWQLSI